MTEITPASQMLRVPTVLLESVKELSRLHRLGHTKLILTELQELIAKLNSTDITIAISNDSAMISELLARLNQVENRVEVLEEELQAYKATNTILDKASTNNVPEEHIDTTGDLPDKVAGGDEEAITPTTQEEITTKELAEILGISRQAMQQKEKKGTLKNLGWELVEGTGTSRGNPGKYRRIKN